MIPSLEARGWWRLKDEEEATKEAEEAEANKEEEEDDKDATTDVVVPPPLSFSISFAPRRAAIPKSASLTTPEALTRTLAAFTSRWTTP